MEDELDEISNGAKNYKDVLTEFWTGFNNAVEASNGLSMSDITDAIDAELGSHFFPKTEDGHDPRQCPDCGTGRLGIKLGKFGGFIGCSNYPTCKYTKPLILNDDEEGDSSPAPKAAHSRICASARACSQRVTFSRASSKARLGGCVRERVPDSVKEKIQKRI